MKEIKGNLRDKKGNIDVANIQYGNNGFNKNSIYSAIRNTPRILNNAFIRAINESNHRYYERY